VCHREYNLALVLRVFDFHCLKAQTDDMVYNSNNSTKTRCHPFWKCEERKYPRKSYYKNFLLEDIH
jgi:hypothetical protein